MSNVKITDLPSLTGALSDSLDVLPVVDVSGDATSKMTRAEFFQNVPAITTVGNVGIGVAPAVALDIGNQVTPQVRLLSTTNAVDLRMQSVGGSATAVIGTLSNHPMALFANNTEKFRIGTSGQWGIGGTNYGTTGQTIVSAGSAAAPAWGTLPAVGGGTGITSYAIGDLVYASTTTALSKLADVATGNALISGGVGVAPSYGKIGLTTHISGTLPVANGGTNITSYAIGDLIYASTTGVLSKLADVATGNALISGGVGVAPAYGKIGLTTHVSGTLPLANGGTNATTGAGAFANMMGYTTVATAAGTTVLTNTSTQYQLFTGATTQTITLPVTSTLTTGWTFHIVNNSTGNLTVNSSGANLVATVFPNMTLMVTCIGTTLTTAADWEFGFTDFGSVTGTGAVVLASGATLTGATLTTGAFNGTVGATTASSGAFTSLTSTSGGINGTVGATTPSSVAATTVTASTSVLSSGSGGIGYSTGAGVAVTQLTSRTTAAPTTGAKTSGAVTLFTTTAVVGTYFTFTVPNTAIAVTDTVVVTVRGATNTYVAFVSAIVAATSFNVTMASVAGTASDTPIVNFTIIKGVSA